MSRQVCRWLVVSAVLVLLLASVGPTGGTPHPPPAGADTNASSPHSPPAPEGTPLGMKIAAIEALDSLEVEDRPRRRHRTRAIDALSASVSAHRDAERVRRVAFRHDRVALVSIARLSGANREVDAVANQVVSADRATAETALEDAKRANRRFGGELDPEVRRRVERAIGGAERALDRGRRARDAGRRPGPGGIRAINRFYRSWLRSQRALDTIERGVQPAVTITTRSDPAWNGSVPRMRTIRGTVSAVRPSDLPALDVSVDGRAAGTADLHAPTAPATNASFAVNVSLEAPPVAVEIAVASRDRSSRRGPPDRGPNRRRGRFDRPGTGHEPPGATHGEPTTAVVRFDGDGLPDTYEVETVGTDPLARDSDTAATDADEAGNGRLDGGEDFDGDRLITYAEFDRGTDPFDGDTDGDGLGDRFESAVPTVDPTASDTDGDGIPDGAEDFDGDGLQAADERAAGTSIWRADTDRDGLRDGPEVHRLGTSPVDDDTDSDRLDDGEERRLGTDPTDRDTDGDGVADGEERFRTSTEEPETGASVSVVGVGAAATDVTIEPVAQPTGLHVVAGPVIRIENRSAFDAATVTLPLDPTVGLADLSMFTWKPGADRPWHPIASSVDRVNRTVRANVTSFSYFAAVDRTRWRNHTTATVELNWPRFDGFADMAGWSAGSGTDVVDGRLVVSGRRADVIVDGGGEGDFRRIQPALDAAEAGETVLVREGTYVEQLVLHTPVRLVGVNATIRAPHVAGETTGIRILDGVPSRVSGVTLDGYHRGIEAGATSSEVRIEKVSFSNTETAIAAEDTTGDWHLVSLQAAVSGSYAVDADRSAGDWTISSSSFVGGGIRAPSSSGNWTLTDAVIAGRHDAIDAWRTSGDWELRRTELSAPEDGIDAYAAVGDFTLRKVVSAGNEVGLDAYHAGGNWTVAGANLSGNGDFGVYGAYASGSWTISDANVSANGVSGIAASRSIGDWTLTDVVASGNANAGIDAYGAAGDWSLSGVEAARNRGWSGVDAYGSSGDWSVSGVDLSDNGIDGLAASAASGRWRVTAARLVGNGVAGLDAGRSRGSISVERSSILGNLGADVDGRSAAATIRATQIWWGHPGGPTEGRVLGAVTVEDACPDPGCVPPASRIEPFDGRGIGATLDPSRATIPDTSATGATRVRRELSLPGTEPTVTITASVAATVSGDGLAAVRLLTENGSATVAAFTGNRTVDREVSATVPDVPGERATLEVVAAGPATIAVDWVRLAYDSDGDGLGDLVERSSFGLPFGPVPGAPLAGLDPANPDTDGDGIPDGRELTTEIIPQSPGETSRTFVIRPATATSDPTSTNSDGGGLNDAEELRRGSDPFVLETIVAGYAVPTMTHGSGTDLEAANPMTMAEVDGLQVGDREASDLIAWPSRQFFDPFFCIAELTPGPGCSPAWMRGVSIREDRHYVYVPFVVYLNSDVDLVGVQYELTFSGANFAEVVKRVNASGSIHSSTTRRGYVIYELPDQQAGVEGYAAAFRRLGKIEVSMRLAETIFQREAPAEVESSYSVSTSTVLPRMEQVLEDTRFVLSQGLTIASAANSGYRVAIETGSSSRGALVFLFELATAQIDTPPTSAEDLAKTASDKGLASFQREIRDTERDNLRDIFGGGVARPLGPTIVRRN